MNGLHFGRGIFYLGFAHRVGGVAGGIHKGETTGAMAGSGLLSRGWVMADRGGHDSVCGAGVLCGSMRDRQPARLADCRPPIVDKNNNERASNISIAAMVAGAAR